MELQDGPYVALLLKGRVARGVLGEFVGPKLPAWGALVNPVFLHVSEEIHLAVWLEEGLDRGAGVWRDGRSVGSAVGCIGGRMRVILTAVTRMRRLIHVHTNQGLLVERKGLAEHTLGRSTGCSFHCKNLAQAIRC